MQTTIRKTTLTTLSTAQRSFPFKSSHLPHLH